MALTPVQKELGKISADYRRFQVLRQLSLCWGVFILVALFLFLLYKEFAITVPNFLPILGIGALVAGAIVIWRNSRVEVALREIARQVEADDPALNTLLLAAAEQNPDPKTGQLNVLQLRVIREALEANRKSPWNQRFVERLFFVQCVHLMLFAGVCVLVAGLAFAVPNKFFSTQGNAAVQITPGDVSLEKGSAVAIMAKFRRAQGTDVTHLYRTHSKGDKKLSMTRSLNDPLFGASFTDVQEETTYQVQFGNQISPEYHIRIFEYPELKRADAELKYPEYTGFTPAKIEDTRRLTAVEGTDVRYTFYVNKPLRSAVLRAKDKAELRLTNDVSKKILYSTAFPLTESKDYALELVDEEGRTNKLPADFVFVALKNERPKLKLQAPRGDQRVSALQEIHFEGQAEDDFGLTRYGLAYMLAGGKTETLDLTTPPPAAKAKMISKPHEAVKYNWLLPLEKLSVEPGELVSYYLWAEDLGPDGQPRHTAGDIYFAEVRPFEEIFRENNSDSSSSQQQQQQNNPASQLLELQKQIITASWNIQRREAAEKLSREYKKDTSVVHESQDSAISKAEELKEKTNDEKSRALADTAVKAMTSASKSLSEASSKNKLEPLMTALDSEQAAYQALLKLQAHEYQVSRSRSRGGGQNAAQQRAQRQLDQLELKNEENRYETESQASPLQSEEQRETLQVLNRLKELARRQEDMSERLKELQTALNEAKTEQEKQKLERELKRLQEEQQQIVQDMDELRQRMSKPENQSRMAESRQQLDQSRNQSRDAAQQLEQGNVGQALSSSARAQQQLQELSDKFRKSTSSQFADQMREMRQEARELDKKEQDIAKKMEESQDARQRSLSDEGPKKEILEALTQQKSGLTNLLQNIRKVTEQSEAAEPLLSRQLYESLRKTSQASPEKTLDLASQMLERNFLPQATEAESKARESIQNLKQSVERAANDVLGDEAESLRFAQRELQNLKDRIDREMAAALGEDGTNGAAGARGGSTNSPLATLPGGQGTNRMARARAGQNGTNSLASSQSSTNRNGSASGQSQRRKNGQQLASNEQSGQNGQSDQNSSGQQQGQQGQQGKQGSGGMGSGSQTQQASNDAQNQEGQQGQNGQGQNGSQVGFDSGAFDERSEPWSPDPRERAGTKTQLPTTTSHSLPN